MYSFVAGISIAASSSSLLVLLTVCSSERALCAGPGGVVIPGRGGFLFWGELNPGGCQCPGERGAF